MKRDMKLFMIAVSVFCSYLMLSLPFSSALQINFIFNQATLDSVIISPQSLVTKEIDIEHDQFWSKINVHLELRVAQPQYEIKRAYVYFCGGMDPVDCITKDPVTFESYVNVSKNWNDVFSGQMYSYPQTTNVLTIVRVDVGGKMTWTGFWDTIERTSTREFKVRSYDTSSLDAYLKSSSDLNLTKKFVEDYQMIPSLWVDAVSFGMINQTDTQALYGVGANQTEMPQFRGWQAMGRTVGEIGKEFELVFPATSSMTSNPITMNLNPPYTCGNSVCESDTGENQANCCLDCTDPQTRACTGDLENYTCYVDQDTPNGYCGSKCGENGCEQGETASSCCLDCGCQAGFLCDVNQWIPEGTCRNESAINLLLDSAKTQYSCCEIPHEVELAVHISNAPSDLKVQQWYYLLNNETGTSISSERPQSVDIPNASVPHTYNLKIHVEPLVDCVKGTHRLEPNKLFALVTYNNGKDFKELSTDLPAIILDQEAISMKQIQENMKERMQAVMDFITGCPVMCLIKIMLIICIIAILASFVIGIGAGIGYYKSGERAFTGSGGQTRLLSAAGPTGALTFPAPSEPEGPRLSFEGADDVYWAKSSETGGWFRVGKITDLGGAAMTGPTAVHMSDFASNILTKAKVGIDGLEVKVFSGVPDDVSTTIVASDGIISGSFFQRSGLYTAPSGRVYYKGWGWQDTTRLKTTHVPSGSMWRTASWEELKAYDMKTIEMQLTSKYQKAAPAGTDYKTHTIGGQTLDEAIAKADREWALAKGRSKFKTRADVDAATEQGTVTTPAQATGSDGTTYTAKPDDATKLVNPQTNQEIDVSGLKGTFAVVVGGKAVGVEDWTAQNLNSLNFKKSGVPGTFDLTDAKDATGWEWNGKVMVKGTETKTLENWMKDSNVEIDPDSIEGAFGQGAKLIKVEKTQTTASTGSWKRLAGAFAEGLAAMKVGLEISKLICGMVSALINLFTGIVKIWTKYIAFQTCMEMYENYVGKGMCDKNPESCVNVLLNCMKSLDDIKDDALDLVPNVAGDLYTGGRGTTSAHISMYEVGKAGAVRETCNDRKVYFKLYYGIYSELSMWIKPPRADAYQLNEPAIKSRLPLEDAKAASASTIFTDGDGRYTFSLYGNKESVGSFTVSYKTSCDGLEGTTDKAFSNKIQADYLNPASSSLGTFRGHLEKSQYDTDTQVQVARPKLKRAMEYIGYTKTEISNGKYATALQFLKQTQTDINEIVGLTLPFKTDFSKMRYLTNTANNDGAKQLVDKAVTELEEAKK